MIKSIKTLAAASIFVTVSTSLAAPRLLYFDAGTIDSQAERAIIEAADIANRKTGAENIEVAGLFLGDEIKKDGVNTISFSGNTKAKAPIVTAVYPKADKTADPEFDIIVNDDMNYRSSDVELVKALAKTFEKLIRK